MPLSEERVLRAIPAKERNYNLAIKLLEKLKDNSYFKEEWNCYWSEKAYNDFKENIVEKLKADSPQRMDMFNIYSEGISYETRFAITKKAVNELIEEERVIEKIQYKHGVPVSEYYYCEKSNIDE